MRLYQPSPVLSSDPLYPPIPPSHRPFMLKRHWHTKTLTSSSAVHCYSTYSQAPYTPTHTHQNNLAQSPNQRVSVIQTPPLLPWNPSHSPQRLQRNQSSEEWTDYWNIRGKKGRQSCKNKPFILLHSSCKLCNQNFAIYHQLQVFLKMPAKRVIVPDFTRNSMQTKAEY